MKKYYLQFNTALCALTAVLAMSCEMRTPDNWTELPLEFELSIGNDGTKATSTAFEDGDVLGLYGFYSASGGVEESFATTPCITNEIVDVTGGQAFTRNAVYFPDDNGTVDFCMYYPYQDYEFNGSFLTFYLMPDQSVEANYKNADIMVAHAVGVGENQSPIQFVFDRLMSKVSLELVPGDGYSSAGDLSGAEALFYDMKKNAVTYFATKTVDAIDYSDFIPHGHFSVSEDGSCVSGVSAIFPPQTLEKGKLFFNIQVAGRLYGLVMPETLELLPGKEYVYTLTLNRSGGDLISIQPTVRDWTSGIEHEFTPDETDPELLPVYDYDGNRYDVVRIGEQIWMASNLRTTHFNNGEEIPFLESQTDWDYTDVSESPAYCYYGINEANRGKYGLLYNWFAAREDDICPEGWQVPSSSDWNQLIEYLGGAGAAAKLKSTSGWLDADGNEDPAWQGTDDYGFNALPGGYRRHRVDFENIGVQGKWWTYELSSEDNSAGNYFYMMYNIQDVKKLYHLKEYGLSIRCIKKEKPSEPELPGENDYVENGVNHGPGVVIDGLLWAPVNCGYDETAYPYGKLFQWGRPFGQGYDGVDEGGFYTLGDNLVSTASSEAEGADPANKDKHFRQNPYGDWCSSREYSQTWKEEYSPCPEGWRVPTSAEMLSVAGHSSDLVTVDGITGAWLSGSAEYADGVTAIFLPAAGNRDVTGRSDWRGTDMVAYWSADWTGEKPGQLYKYGSYVSVLETSAAAAYPVRCVKDMF